MHAAEDDELRIGSGCGVASELEGITGDIGELDDLVALIVMTEDEEPIAQGSLRSPRPLDECRVRGRRQIAWTLDASLRPRVRLLSENEQR